MSKTSGNGGGITIRGGDGAGGSNGDFEVSNGEITIDLGGMDVTPIGGNWSSGDMQFTFGTPTTEDQVADLKNRLLSLLDGSGEERLKIDESGYVSFEKRDSSMCIKCSTAKKRLSGPAGAYEYDGLCWSCFES